MGKLFDYIRGALRRMYAFLDAKQTEWKRHNWEILCWMLPIYLAVLIFGRFLTNVTALQGIIFNSAIVIHAVLCVCVWAAAKAGRPPRDGGLNLVLLVFGMEILGTVALAETIGAPASQAILYPLALVMMLQIYTVSPAHAASVLVSGASGFLVLAAIFKEPVIFARDALAVLAATTLSIICYTSAAYNQVVSYEEQKRLHYLSIHDPLTGMFNVSAFEQQYHDRFCGQQHLFAILDMDNFKEINDSEGHKKGDSVLMVFSAAVAEQLKEQFPESLVGRFGGDEFLIAASGYDGLDDVTQRLETVQTEVCRRMQSSFSRSITFSMGVVLCHENDNFRDVFGWADREMYRAKEGVARGGREVRTGGGTGMEALPSLM